MKNQNSRVSMLKEMIVIEERRSRLQSKIAALESKLTSLHSELYGGAMVSLNADLAPASPLAAGPEDARRAAPLVNARRVVAEKINLSRGSRRGEMKEFILNELKQAGAAGVTIKELSERLGAKYKNIYIWFLTTGKRISGISKVGPARYKIA